MISIKNKEPEECLVLMVDINGNIRYEKTIQANEDLELDIETFARGIYTLIFKTMHTSFVQNFIKY